MSDGSGLGKKALVLLIFASVVLGTLYYFDIFNMKDRVGGWKEKVFSSKTNTQETVVIPSGQGSEVILSTKFGWCEATEIQVSDYAEDPVAQRILGWDEGSSCCLYVVEGWNCAQNKSGSMEYCLTSQVNPTIRYLKIDDNFTTNVALLQSFIVDYDKRYIENKPCDISKYPGE